MIVRCAGLVASMALCFAAAPITDPYLRFMNGIAQKQLDGREAKINSINGMTEARNRQAEVRAKILGLVGGLPDYSGPLNAKVTGQIPENGFIIEKIIFESLPHVFVTANLYRPTRDGKFPGVLLPLGHWEYGKPAVQRIAANLALKGFVVLTYDPLGQGERQQFYDARLEGSLAGGSVIQHTLAGGLSLLIGQSFARYRIWDAKRALDYLVSRPEVLTDRIGCTGCSGGGTVTTYISALDPRIKVAAPACYISTFRLLFTGPVGDSEQSLPNFISSGLDIPDYIELFAPKPWLISSTQDDFFPIEASRMAYEEARKWYGLYDAQDKIKRVVGPGGHGTPLVVREAIYDWMIHWLKDGDGSPKEQEVGLLPEPTLWATPNGQVADLPGSREVFDVLRDDYLHRKQPRPRAELVSMLQTMIDPPKLPPAVHQQAEIITFETEPGLNVSGAILTPGKSGRHPGVLLVDMRGKMPERARELANAGNVVVVITPRALPPGPDIRAFWGDWLPNVRALLVGRNLPAMRAHDILNAYQILKRRQDVDPARISAEASGVAGIWLLMAAAVEKGISSITITQTPYSFAEAFEHPLTRDLHCAVIPGFALKWDLADLVEPQRVSWVDPSDWLGHVVPLRGSNYRFQPAEQ
jgi:dienelactone hydrolase